MAILLWFGVEKMRETLEIVFAHKLKGRSQDKH